MDRLTEDLILDKASSEVTLDNADVVVLDTLFIQVLTTFIFTATIIANAHTTEGVMFCLCSSPKRSHFSILLAKRASESIASTISRPRLVNDFIEMLS